MGRSKELFEMMREEISIITESCYEGNVSYLDALISLREIRESSEKLIEKVKEFEDDNINKISDESQNFNNKYNGFEILKMAGRETFNFSNVKEITEIEEILKSKKKFYESAFKGIMNGKVRIHKEIVTIKYIEDGEIKEKEEEVKYWIDENTGGLKEIPTLNIGKSFITVKKQR